MLMTRNKDVIVRILDECVDLCAGGWTSPSLNHLAQRVAKSTALNPKTVAREFKANPDRYPLAALLLSESCPKGVLPDRCSDLPKHPNSDRVLSESCPKPVQHPIGPGPESVSPQVTGVPLARPHGHPNQSLPSTLSTGSLSRPSPKLYSRIGCPSKYPASCYFCNEPIEAFEGRMLLPFKQPDVRVICNTDEDHLLWFETMKTLDDVGPF